MYAYNKQFKRLVKLYALVLLAASLAACAGQSAKQQLLAQDHLQMTDDEILLYYYQLSDEIETSESRSTGSSVSFGFGAGSYGTRSGVGLSTGGGRSYAAKELRERRNQVRLELERRALTPR